MALADLALLLANIVYGTSYVVTRVALADVPPATLALLRVLIAAAVLVPLSLRTRVRLSGREHARIVGMGVVGFAAAFALGHWGLAQSTATNAALLIVAEPLGLILLGPVVLREHLRRSEAFGAGLALIGATLVVVNGIPGLTHALLPRWRGDLLLVLSGLAYAAYSILGRPILKHRPALPVTALSALWGVPGLVPLVTQEWLDGQRGVHGLGRRGRPLSRRRDHRAGVSRLELGARAGAGSPRGYLRQFTTRRRRAPGRAAPRRRRERIHGRRWGADRARIVPNHEARARMNDILETCRSPAVISSSRLPPTA